MIQPDEFEPDVRPARAPRASVPLNATIEQLGTSDITNHRVRDLPVAAFGSTRTLTPEGGDRPCNCRSASSSRSTRYVGC